MARRKLKSVMREKAFQLWMRAPRDPVIRAVYFTVELITSLDRRTRLGHDAGWVYAARNPRFGPDVLKIGETRLSPLERIDQLSNSTAIYEPFELVYFIHTAEREDAEAMVHAMLGTCRITPRREFFEVDALQAAEAMVRVAEIMGSGMKRWMPSYQRHRWCASIFMQYEHNLMTIDESLIKELRQALKCDTNPLKPTLTTAYTHLLTN